MAGKNMAAEYHRCPKSTEPSENTSDLDLAQAVSNGSVEAWHRLIDQYSGLIYTVVRRNLFAAKDDEVRTVFVDILEALYDGKPCDHAHRLCQRELRKALQLCDGAFNLAGIVWKPHLHEKLYCFSHPKAVAFIGSFNPSGDDPEKRPDIIHEIGDQDRGHNVLVGLSDPLLVDGLVSHARWVNRARHGMFGRFFASGKQTLRTGDTEVHFLPRLSSHAVARFLGRFGKGSRIRIAASHISGRSTLNAIIGLARRGAALEILAEPTFRRVPAEVEENLTSAGIPFRRISHPEGLPMHHKFVLVEENSYRWVVFGSYNWTTRSYWLNNEICAISTNRQLYNAFAERWEIMESQKA